MVHSVPQRQFVANHVLFISLLAIIFHLSSLPYVINVIYPSIRMGGGRGVEMGYVKRWKDLGWGRIVYHGGGMWWEVGLSKREGRLWRVVCCEKKLWKVVGGWQGEG